MRHMGLGWVLDIITHLIACRAMHMCAWKTPATWNAAFFLKYFTVKGINIKIMHHI